jgi:hypothetical protein
MPFCPGCGLNVADLDEEAARSEGPSDSVAAEPVGASLLDLEAPATVPDADGGVASPAAAIATPPPMIPERRWLSIPPVVIASVFVMVGLIAFGLLTRPAPGGLPGNEGQPPPGATPTAPPALIVGLSILSPSDGQVVGAAEVTVIGTAPPGVSITQDISFGLDQHASVDGTGHWAIKVGLNEGDNKLTFRIGDDHSTERTVHVTYTPQRTP